MITSKKNIHQIQYQVLVGIPNPDDFGDLVDLNERCFGLHESSEILETFFLNQKQICFCLAFDGSSQKRKSLIGFKIGYEVSSEIFESWRGGVLEGYRRMGIASELMRLQHQWCSGEQFRVIETVANAQNHAMLILNLQHGFGIVNCVQNQKGVLKIHMEKFL